MKDKIKIKQYSQNPEKFKQVAKQWRCDNPDKIREQRQNPRYRLHNNISRAIRRALNDRKCGRKWESIIGYSLEDLIRHLEAGFTDDMSWENYGEWEVDHVKPRVSFDFSNELQLKECWQLNNLQPLWMHDNRVKSAKAFI